ncbi:MAG: hypothetical protein ACI89A_000228 [Porticoccaceae bacterium]|jgi:hypothetical protein
MDSIQRRCAIVGSKLKVTPNVGAIDSFWAKAIVENPSLERDHQVN